MKEGDVVRLKRSPELKGRVIGRGDNCTILVTPIDRHGFAVAGWLDAGWFYADQLELVAGQEEVIEA